jgi:hypothetical protein
VNNRKDTRNWTREEMNYMTYEWGIATVESIARYLGRTPVAVIVKSKRLGLGSPYRKTKFTSHRLSHLLGIDQHTITDYWVPKCGLKCRRMEMRYKKGKFLQIIDYDNLMEWLQKNQDKWDSRRFKRFALKIEPEWLRQKRILDSYEPKRKYQKWTRMEDLRLLDLFYKKRKTMKEISLIMERSYNSIDHRLSRIRPYKKARRKELINDLS